MGTATTFDDLIVNPESEKVFLLEIKVAEQISGTIATTDYPIGVFVFAPGTGFEFTDGTGFVWDSSAGGTAPALYTYQFAYLNETITLDDGSTESIRKAVVALEADGVTYTAKTSIAGVESNASSYYHDTTNGILYIHMADDGSPNHHTVVVYFWMYFATKGIVLNSTYYEPYISEDGLPELSQVVSEVHWGVAEIGGGQIVLINARGFFDQIAVKFIWTNKIVNVLLGGDSLAYAEYTTVFSGKITDKTFTEERFSLGVKSYSFDLLRTIPVNHFWTTDYPSLDPGAEGKSIPYYWGVYDVNQAPLATCINSAYAASTYQFKICDCTHHAIRSITQVYIDYGDGGGWQTIAHGNEDLAAATFTIVSASFVLGTSRIKVAFEGYHVATVLIEGAPQVVEDILLNQCGYVAGDLEATSFTTSIESSDCLLNVFVESEVTALSVIEGICRSDLAYFDESGTGKLRYRTWIPGISGTIPVLTSTDIIGIPTIKENYDKIYYKILVGYSRFLSLGTDIYYESSNLIGFYKYGKKEVLIYDTYLRSSAYAASLAERVLWILRDTTAVISLELKLAQIEKSMGDKIKVTLARTPYATAGGYSERIFEIMAKSLSAFPARLNIEARDLMTYGSGVGFWTAATAPAWLTATEEERNASGFWCDANGYCLTADPNSYNKSRWW